ncbi:GNAT family N-acetyltransferase [Streptomyces bottropensis]|jgi:RimJ/RimL family protein N-acetyltransferase|uniref:GNAT family N-acetyltransferase n=1 Tax=Streptomyces bottropensis TaxID=42235 RepID=UPI00369E5CDF
MSESELTTVAGFAVSDPVHRIGPERFRKEYEVRRFRPEWTWVAEDEGRIVGRALWWGRSDSEHPIALDCLQVDPCAGDRVAVAAGLLAAGHTEFERRGATQRPEYNIMLTPGWRESPDALAAVDWRTAAARLAGLTDELERLRFEWTPECGLPAPESRLVFRAEPDDEVFLDAFRRVAVGTLDIGTRRERAALGPERQAREDLEFYLACPGKREWWRLVYTPAGGLAGLAIPSATPYSRNVGYLGVVPALRGNGYVDDVLREITRVHAEDGAELITATTDTTNRPMAAAFDRAGYRNTEIRLLLEAPPR